MADNNDVKVSLTATTADFQKEMKDSQSAAKEAFSGIRMSAEEAKKVFGDFSGSAATMAKQLQTSLGGAGQTARAAAVDFQSIINASTGVGAATKSAASSAAFFEEQMGLTAQKTLALRAALNSTSGAINLNRMGMMELQAAGINAFQALAAGISPLRVLETEGAQVFGALVQGGVLTKNTFLAMNPAIYAAVAAVGALGAVFISMAINAKEARDAILGVNSAAVLMGHTGFSTAATEGFISDLRRLPNVSTEVAGQVARTMEIIPQASQRTREELGKLSVAFADLAKVDPAKGAEELAKVAAGGGQAVIAFAERYNIALTDQQRQTLQAAAASRDYYTSQGILLDALGNRLKVVTDRYDQLYKMQHSGSRFAGAATAALQESPFKVEDKGPSQEESATAAITDQVLRTKQEIAGIQAQINTLENSAKTATGQQKQDLDDALTILKNKLAVSQQQFETEKNGGIDALNALRDQLAQEEASTGASMTQQLTVRRDFWKKSLDDQKLTAKQREEVEREYNNAVKALNTQAAQDRAASLDSEIAATQQGTQARIAALQKRADLEKQIYGASSKEYMQAEAQVVAASREYDQKRLQDKLAQMNDEAALARDGSQEKIDILRRETALVAQEYGKQSREYANALKLQTEAERQQLADQIRAQQETVDTQKQIELLKIEDLRAGYDLDVQLGRTTGAQKVELLRQLAQQEYDIERQALQRKLELAAQDPTHSPDEVRRINAELEILEQQHVNKMNALNRQAVVETQQRWQRIVAPIDQAWAQITNGLLQGTQTWQQVVGGAVDKIVAATAQGAEQMLSKWLVNLAAGSAAQAASSQTQIGNDAATSAANVYSSVSSIPYIGWILAPAAAAAAFAAVSAFGSGISSFAVGTGDVPQDMTAKIHKGEIIVPATMSDAIRSGQLALTNGSGGSFGSALNPQFHYGPTIHGTVPKSLEQMLAEESRAMQRWFTRSVRDGSLKIPQARSA